MSFDNYIFDLYGTLIDLRTDEHAAQTWKKWLRWLDKRGVQHPVYYKFRKDFWDMDKACRTRAQAEGKYEVVEIDVIPIYRELFIRYGNPEYSDEFLKEASYAFRVASRDYIRLFPGVEAYLKEIRDTGRHSYILSNAQASYTWPEIVWFGLDRLTDDQMMSSDKGCMKPDKAFFEMMIEKHGLDKDKSVMIGDNASCDVAGADAVGLPSIHLAGENAPQTFYLNRKYL